MGDTVLSWNVRVMRVDERKDMDEIDYDHDALGVGRHRDHDPHA